MRLIAFNLKKDIKIILVNILILSLLIFISLQIYGLYWFDYEYQLDEILHDVGIKSNINEMDAEKINKIFTNKGIKTLRLSYDLDLNKADFKELDIKEFKEKAWVRVPYEFKSLANTDTDSNPYIGNYIDIFSNEDDIMIPSYLYEYYGYNIGDTININGVDFTIRGATGEDIRNIFLIPINGAKKIGINEAKLVINFEKGLSSREISKIKDDATSNLNSDFSYPDYKRYTKDGNIKIFSLLIVFVLISILNITLIYNYHLEKRKNRRNIYRTEGMTYSMLIGNYMLEVFIIMIFSALISYLMISVINKCILMDMLNIYRFSLPFENYVLLYLTFFIVYILSVIISNHRNIRKNTI